MKHYVLSDCRRDLGCAGRRAWQLRYCNLCAAYRLRARCHTHSSIYVAFRQKGATKRRYGKQRQPLGGRDPIVFLAAWPNVGSLSRHTENCWMAYCATPQLKWHRAFETTLRTLGRFFRISIRLTGSWGVAGGNRPVCQRLEACLCDR